MTGELFEALNEFIDAKIDLAFAEREIGEDGMTDGKPKHRQRVRDAVSKIGTLIAVKEPKIDSARPQSLAEVVRLFSERNYPNAEVESESFWNYYESNGWRVGKNPMKNWRAAAANWNKNAKLYGESNGTNRRSNRQAGAGGTTTADDLRRSLEMARQLADARKARGE